MRQSWTDRRLQYEHIKEQKKIPDSRKICRYLFYLLTYIHFYDKYKFVNQCTLYKILDLSHLVTLNNWTFLQLQNIDDFPVKFIFSCFKIMQFWLSSLHFTMINWNHLWLHGEVYLLLYIIDIFYVYSIFFFIVDRIRYLTMTDASKIWMPDTFFRNEKIGSFHTILQPNLYIRIFPDGTVLYSIRWVTESKGNSPTLLHPYSQEWKLELETNLHGSFHNHQSRRGPH